MKKKLFIGVLSLAISASTVSAECLNVAYADDIQDIDEIVLEQTTEGTYDEFEFSVLDDDTLEITKYIGTDGDVSIPYKVDGKFVSSIGELAFANNENLTYVFMYDSVTYIADNAFQGCENVEFNAYPDTYACQYAAEHGIDCIVLEDDDLITDDLNDNVTLGDINRDGKITTADVGIANSFVKSIREPSSTELMAADMNKDGKISTSDVGMINLVAKSGSEIVNYEYEAVVLEVEDGKVLRAEVNISSNEITEAWLEYGDNPVIDSDIAVGDKVKIVSNGEIIDTDPPIITNVQSVEKIS